jgi:DNA replication protein DnaC
MMAAAREFLSGTGPRVLVLTGEIGMGKSHLAEAIGRMLLRTGRTVRWDKTSDLLEKLRHTQSFESTETLHSVLETYRRYYCLILDDIGVRGQETEWAIDKLTALIDRRMENGQWLVITTNRNRDQMAQAVGPRLADRLFSTNPSLNDVRIVVCSGQSYRR